MKRAIKLGYAVVLAAWCFSASECLAQRPPRLPVEIGPTSPECPFGICPATEKPRTARDFVLLFGYLPPSSGVKMSGVPTSPPKNFPTEYWTPTPEQWKRMNGDPTALQKLTSHSPTPPANSIPPEASASPSPAKPTPAQPPKNASPTKPLTQLTTADADEMKRQLGAKQAKLVDEIGQRVNNAPDPNRRAALQKTLETVGDRINNGGVAGRDITDLVSVIKSALPPADQGPALAAAGQIAANQQVTNWINGNGGRTNGAVAGNIGTGATVNNNTANPGTGGSLGANNAAGGAGPINPATGRPWLNMPNAAGGAGPGVANAAGGAGGNVPMALIPGLPLGLIIPLPFDNGGGAALIGMGRPGGQILLGTGDPDQVAGLTVAPPDAPPAPDAAGVPASGDTVLGNAAAAPIGYAVNQSPFTIQPQQEQTLPAGTAWIVEFDRGGGRGTARYQLEPGYYEFRSVAGGWELYQQQFAVTFDNIGGQSPFTYVVDGRTETLDVGQKRDLTGIYPPVVRFDNGAGQVKERRLTSNAYRVALGADRTLDLFTIESLKLPPAPLPPSSESITTSVDAAGSQPAATSGLPPGFQLFDVTGAISDRTTAPRIPAGFSLFDDVAASP